MSRPEDLQNWALRDNISLGPHCRIDTCNPEYGYGGGTVFAVITEKNNTILPHILEQLKMVN